MPRSDLHTIGRRYLSPAQSVCFDLLVLLTFISTLISYALAGSKAFVNLNQIIHPDAGDNSQAIITPFVLACACAIIFFEGLLKPAIAFGTAFKVVLLIGIVAIVGVVAGHVDLSPSTSWSDVMQPFLVGTVAIGGIGNLLPAFVDSYLITPPPPAAPPSPSASPAALAEAAEAAAAIANDPDHPSNLPKAFYQKAMRHFRAATAAGVIACYALNIAWAAAVTKIVPQTIEDASKQGFPASQSLEYAANNGEPATTPVVTIINQQYPQFTWVATTVSIFIAVSIVVSFNAVGLGTRHVLDGMAVSGFRAFGKKMGISAQSIHDAIVTWGGASHAGNHEKQHKNTQPAVDYGVVAVPAPDASHQHAHHAHHGYPTTGVAGAWHRFIHSANKAWYQLRHNPAARGMVASRGVFYIIVFGLVLLVALLNPQGFITVLEVFTSLALNSSGGIFVAIIYLTAVLPKGLGGCGAPEITQASIDAKRAERKKEARRASQEAAALVEATETAARVDAEAATARPSAVVRRCSEVSSDSDDDSVDNDDEERLLTLPPLDQVPIRPRVLGLNLFWARLLSGFSLVAFFVAVAYDAYSAVEEKETVVAGIFALLVSLLCFWSFAMRPYLASLLWLDVCFKPELREREIDGVLSIDGVFSGKVRPVGADDGFGGGSGKHAGTVAVGIARRASADVTTPLTGGGRKQQQQGKNKRGSSDAVGSSAGAGEGIVVTAPGAGPTLDAAAVTEVGGHLRRGGTAGISMKEVAHRSKSSEAEGKDDPSEGGSAADYGSSLGLGSGSGSGGAAAGGSAVVSPGGVVVVTHVSGGEKISTGHSPADHHHHHHHQGGKSKGSTQAPAVVINSMQSTSAGGVGSTAINSVVAVPPQPPRKFLSFVWTVISTRNPAEQIVPILACIGVVLLHLQGCVDSTVANALSIAGGLLVVVSHFVTTLLFGGSVPGSYSRIADETGFFSPNTKKKLKTFVEAPPLAIGISRLVDAVGCLLILAAGVVAASSSAASSATGGAGLPAGVAVGMLLLAVVRVVMAGASSGLCGR